VPEASELEVDMGRKWQRPELVCIVRRRPEEAVLANCKVFTGGGGGYANTDAGCFYIGGCVGCDFYGDS